MRKQKNVMSDKRITDATNIRNIRNVYAFSLAVCVVEVISLIAYIIANKNSPEFMRTTLRVGFCTLVCAVVAVLSSLIKKEYKQQGAISNIKATTLTISFYVVLSIWSIAVDYAHYSAGDQMLTFYIVQFCFLCFVVMPYKIGTVIITSVFATLYLVVYFFDGAIHIQLQNYVIFTILAVFGNAMQNMSLQKSEQAMLEIQELNQILKQDASVDDLTQLKNRKALREDFTKHIGKTVSVLMADIDHFKTLNDTYGHVIGDTVLRLVAAATMETFRSGEVYRYGGDELLVILSNCSEDVFEAKKKQWQEAVQAIQIPNISHFISCSSGSVRCELHVEDDLREAIKCADERLYHAKNSR